MTQGHAPPDYIPEEVDGLSILARAIPLKYRAGETREDTARERLGSALLWITMNDPKYAGWEAPTRATIAEGRSGDAEADAAVEEGCSNLASAVDYLRHILVDSWAWVRAQMKKPRRSVFEPPTAAAA